MENEQEKLDQVTAPHVHPRLPPEEPVGMFRSANIFDETLPALQRASLWPPNPLTPWENCMSLRMPLRAIIFPACTFIAA